MRLRRDHILKKEKTPDFCGSQGNVDAIVEVNVPSRVRKIPTPKVNKSLRDL
jgi:hypothetical protein